MEIKEKIKELTAKLLEAIDIDNLSAVEHYEAILSELLRQVVKA